MAKLLDEKQAYSAMILFLEHYYELTKADDIGALLGSMAILEDGNPIDIALWDEWCNAINKVI
jgi:hypothetical protein